MLYVWMITRTVGRLITSLAAVEVEALLVRRLVRGRGGRHQCQKGARSVLVRGRRGSRQCQKGMRSVLVLWVVGATRGE